VKIFKVPRFRIRTLALLTTTLVLLSTLVGSTVIAAANTTAVQMMDTFTAEANMTFTDIDGNRITTVKAATLIITDNTVATFGVIANGTLAISGYATMTVTGYIGKGNNPTLVLSGSGTDAKATIIAKVHAHVGVVQTITGTINGVGTHSQGTLGDDPAGAVASWSVAQQYDGTTSALLVADAVTGSTYVQFTPQTGIKLNQLDTITTGWSVAHRLENATSNGPQVELKFQKRGTATPDGVAHVDVTLLPYQTTGTGAWVVSQLTGAATNALYYGNDPVDGTAFSDGGVALLNTVEAAINAEGVMGSDSASAWELTRVRVELWEAGARDCWIDQVTINGKVYSFEPASFTGNFKAVP